MNKNIWNLYKKSDQARTVISLFKIENDENLEKKINEIYTFCNNYFGRKEEIINGVNKFFSITNNIFVDNLFPEENETNTDYFNFLIDNIEINVVEVDKNGELFVSEKHSPLIKCKDYKSICSILPDLSLVLYVFSERFFIPILFAEQFDIFIKIMDILGIQIPELPAKSDKRGRLLFYNEINENIIKFSKDNNLTPEETCACIYDFAPMLLEEDDNAQTEMPEPTNVWLTGGSKEDYKTFLEKPVQGAKSVWTCNENTKRGDIIVMYVRAPHSCIQSIWRADIDGVYTPFDFYNSRARVTDGILVPKITLNELKQDNYFSNFPLTRKNFQGVNGVHLTATDYKELQRLFAEKGFDTSILPQLYKPNLEIEGELKNEKDVEEKLLIPILSKLGYSDADWSRQLSQKAGRKEKAIPDFVFLPKGEIHFQNAPLVIEAKFDMSSNIVRTQSYNQALSYARLMKAQIFGICDRDRLIIYKEKKGYFDRFNPTFEKHWQNINDIETFRELKLLIGKDAIKSLK